MHPMYMSKPKQKQTTSKKATYNNLLTWREQNEWTAQYVAEQIGTTQPTITRIEKGAQQPREEMLLAIVGLFNRSKHDFYDPAKADLKDGFSLIPLRSKEDLIGYSIDDLSNIATSKMKVPSALAVPPTSFAMTLGDDSMSPSISVGAILVIDTKARLTPGCKVVARLHRDEIIVGEYRPDRINDKRKVYFEIVPANESHASRRSDVAPMVILGRVIARFEFNV